MRYKNKSLKIIGLIFLLTLNVCGCSKSNITAPPKGKSVIKWMFPSKTPAQDSRQIYEQANNIIQNYLPDIKVDFDPVNKYEYAYKLAVYIASEEQIDIAWTGDELSPLLSNIEDNNFKMQLVSKQIISLYPHLIISFLHRN